MGIGGSDGLGRQNTIMQRFVGTVLPTSRSTPPANANMCAKAGAFASPPSPSARVSSPTAPCRSASMPGPGNDQTWPQHHCTCICSSCSQSAPGSYAFHSTPVIGLVSSLAGETITIVSPMLTVIRAPRSSRTTQRMTFLCNRQLSRDHQGPERACRRGRLRQQELTRRRT